MLRAHGVNRVSLGAQSLYAHHLRTLGRVHDASDVEAAYAMVREGGIPRVNLDFIYGVPGMTLAVCFADAGVTLLRSDSAVDRVMMAARSRMPTMDAVSERE